MKLTTEIKKYIKQSVLCWLATSSADNFPNVSPKEIFTYHGDSIIIANIASPGTVRNIRENHQVCISFIDVLVQKGYQLKGTAAIIQKSDSEFATLEEILLQMTKGKFPFVSITKILVLSSKKIISPRYLLYPETTEAAQIESAKKTYAL